MFYYTYYDYYVYATFLILYPKYLKISVVEITYLELKQDGIICNIVNWILFMRKRSYSYKVVKKNGFLKASRNNLISSKHNFKQLEPKRIKVKAQYSPYQCFSYTRFFQLSVEFLCVSHFAFQKCAFPWSNPWQFLTLFPMLLYFETKIANERWQSWPQEETSK